MKRHGFSVLHLVALILASVFASDALAKSDEGPHGVGVDVMFLVLGLISGESMNGLRLTRRGNHPAVQRE